MKIDGIEHLESLYAVNSAVASAPHEAEPLDPVVGGHGGVPHTVTAIVQTVQTADRQQQQERPARQS